MNLATTTGWGERCPRIVKGLGTGTIHKTPKSEEIFVINSSQQSFLSNEKHIHSIITCLYAAEGIWKLTIMRTYCWQISSDVALLRFHIALGSHWSWFFEDTWYFLWNQEIPKCSLCWTINEECNWNSLLDPIRYNTLISIIFLSQGLLLEKPFFYENNHSCL